MNFLPVFLISSPRSGSNWTRAALNAHPEILCTEQRLYGGFMEIWIDDQTTGRSLPRFTVDRMADLMVNHNNYPAADGPLPRERLVERMTGKIGHALFELAHETTGKRVVIDKFTPYPDSCPTVVAGIRRDFPDAKIIYLERDGRDVLTSGVFNWLNRRRQGVEWNAIQRQRYERFFTKTRQAPLERFFSPEDIAYWTSQWTGPVDHVLPVADLTIRYETLHTDQKGELKRLFETLGVASDDATLGRCLEESSFERLSGGRTRGQDDAGNPTAYVRKGIVGDWRNYFTRADGEVFREQAGRQLVARGYAPDNSWIDTLPESLSL